MFPSNSAYLPQIRERNWLATASIVGDRHHYERNSLSSHFIDQGKQLVCIHIAFEWNNLLRFIRFFDDQINWLATICQDVCSSSIKVHIIRDNIISAYHCREQDVFRCAALMGGKQMPKSKDVVHGCLKARKAAAASIRFVATHQACPLLLTHCSSPRVSQQVNIDILRAKVEHIVPRLLDPLLPLI